MKTRIFSAIALTALALSLLPIALEAATGDSMGTATSSNTMSASELPLLVDTIRVHDGNIIDLSFNQSIESASVRVRITDQATQENIRLESITGSLTNTKMVRITMGTPLISGNAYTMTIMSAISLSGVTIKAGVDAIREFTAPQMSPVANEPAGFNAPSNPAAVLSTGSNSSAATGRLMTTSPTMTGSGKSGDVAEALPVTWANSVIILIMAAWAAILILSFRRKA